LVAWTTSSFPARTPNHKRCSLRQVLFILVAVDVHVLVNTIASSDVGLFIRVHSRRLFAPVENSQAAFCVAWPLLTVPSHLQHWSAAPRLRPAVVHRIPL
jgi:hypothetical protein